MITLGELLVSFSLHNIYFYSYSFDNTSIDIYQCFNEYDVLKNNFTYNKIPKIIQLINYILTFLLTYNGYTKEGAKLFKFLFIIYLFSIITVNINIITLCNIYNLSNNIECNKTCNPYGNYKIPFFEILIAINIYMFYYYQAMGYRFLFIISLSKNVSSIIINFNHINNNTVANYIIYNDIYKLYVNVFLNLLTISITEVLYIYANIKAYITIRKDWGYYDHVYDNIKKKEKEQITNFNLILKNIKDDKLIIKQKIEDLDELYDIGYLLNVKFQKILFSITKKTTGILVPSTVKNPKRSIQKICRHYNRDTTQLCDIIRASILFCNNDKCSGECSNCKSVIEDTSSFIDNNNYNNNNNNSNDNINNNNDNINNDNFNYNFLNIKRRINVCDQFLNVNTSSNISFEIIRDNISDEYCKYGLESPMVVSYSNKLNNKNKINRSFENDSNNILDISYNRSNNSLISDNSNVLNIIDDIVDNSNKKSDDIKNDNSIEDENLSQSFTNHIQNIKYHIDRDLSAERQSYEEYSFFSNLMLFIKNLNESKYFKIVKIKNRFDDKYNSKLSVGYRDVLINIKIQYEINGDKIRFLHYNEWNDKNNYIIAEIQLHSIEMYKYKVIHGHENYKKYRNIMTL